MTGIMRNKQKPLIKHNTKKSDKNANSGIHVHNFVNFLAQKNILKIISLNLLMITLNRAYSESLFCF